MHKSTRGAVRVGHKFTVGEKIGEGSFGDIYKGVNITNNEPVAIKFVLAPQTYAGKYGERL